MSMMQFDLQRQGPGSSDSTIPGRCAKCSAGVTESKSTLDDAYNVWSGRCPECKALNLLSTDYGLRGYDAHWMELVLPYDEEVAANGLPADTPTRGKFGQPATMHGSPLGEVTHKLREAELDPEAAEE